MKSTTPSVLVVMHDPKLRAMVGQRFAQEGFAMESAESVEEGERRAVKMRPKVLLVEIPDLEGLGKLIKHWRSLPTLHTAKLVLMLSKADRSHVDEALKKGADQVILSGTVSAKEMVRSVAKLLKAE